MAVKKVGGALSALGSVTAATSAFSSLRQARGTKDKLLMANAVAGIAAAVTGALIAVRSLRKGDDPA